MQNLDEGIIFPFFSILTSNQPEKYQISVKRAHVTFSDIKALCPISGNFRYFYLIPNFCDADAYEQVELTENNQPVGMVAENKVHVVVRMRQ